MPEPLCILRSGQNNDVSRYYVPYNSSLVSFHQGGQCGAVVHTRAAEPQAEGLPDSKGRMAMETPVARHSDGLYAMGMDMGSNTICERDVNTAHPFHPMTLGATGEKPWPGGF